MTGLTADTIVVPVDFPDESIAAIDVALEIADKPANVHVIRVLSDITPMEPGVVWNTADVEVRKRHATTALRERLKNARYDDVQMDIEIGDAGQCITELAERIEADLIVTPSHGRTGLTRLLIGSVAERVVRLAHCPVLVLRK